MDIVIKSGKQCLVLLPEIGLTPQLIQRFKDRFKVDIAIQHSGLSDIERLKYWQDAKTGKAKIILGTRSAVWTPLKKPGIYIVDEEHDLSYKQRSGFQYSARDLLIVRAKRDGVPIVLGSATPSLETINNAEKNRYTRLILPTRAGAARKPEYQLLDIQNKKTGKLFSFCCSSSAIIKEKKLSMKRDLSQIGLQIGLLYQISDDLIDVRGNSNKAGKPTKRDVKRGKATLVNLLGYNNLLEFAYSLKNKLVNKIKKYGTKSRDLLESLEYIIHREV